MEITVTFKDEKHARIARDELDARVRQLQNIMVDAVQAGEREYGKSGKSGFQYAQQLARDVEETRNAFAAINGAVMRARGEI